MFPPHRYLFFKGGSLEGEEVEGWQDEGVGKEKEDVWERWRKELTLFDLDFDANKLCLIFQHFPLYSQEGISLSIFPCKIIIFHFID